jgi:hypothetical protein
MFRLRWTQHGSDCVIQASNEIKVWFWHNALTKDF